MSDVKQIRQARVACRIHLELHPAGPVGEPNATDDALGPVDDPDADHPAAEAVGARLVETRSTTSQATPAAFRDSR